MSKDKWNDIWNIMKTGRLEFVDKCNNDILCVICKNVLINAHGGPCGCRYCFECITNYLNGEEKICPGKTKECEEELIYINKHIFIDQPINKKISTIIVKCPLQNCDFKDELRNIEDHMRICDSGSGDCPYVIMGCKGCNLINTDLEKHVLTEIVSHTKLSFEYIDNLKNEIKVLKETKDEFEKNYNDIKTYMNDFRLKYENDYEEIKLKLKEIENKYDEEQKNTVELRKEIKILNDEIKFMKTDSTENKKSIDHSKIKCENERREIEEKITGIEKNYDEEKTEFTTKIDEINKIVTDLKSISNESDKSISNIMNEMRVLQENQEQGNCGEFVWRIDKWREKTKKHCIASESFYSHRNGYRLCLSIYPNGWMSGSETHLGVSCCSMWGKYDDILPWPFKHGVTFELINQNTTQIHTSFTVKCGDRFKNGSDICYDRYNRKPKRINDLILICCNYEFVLLNELSIDNDQMFIRCRVNIDNQYIDWY